MKKLLLLTTSLAIMSGAASAADLAARPYTKAPALVATTAYNWNGFYIGGHGGYGWGTTDTTQTNAAGVVTSGSSSPQGGFGGGQIGFNYVFAPNWLFGIEGDGSAGNIGTSVSGASATGASTTDGKIDTMATIRGRVGYIWDNVLVYGTGGAGWFNSQRTRTITAVTNPAPAAQALIGQSSTDGGWSTGWVAGAGLEWGFAPNWSAKFEYLYSEFDSSSQFRYTTAASAVNTEGTTRLHTVRVGLNYHFNWGLPGTVKY